MNAVQFDDGRRTDVLNLSQYSGSNDVSRENHGSSLVLSNNARSDASYSSLSAKTTAAPTKRKRKRGKKERKQVAIDAAGSTTTEPPPPPIKIPLPVIVPSLPKSGTTTVHKYFLCGGQKSAHHVYKKNGKIQNKIGRCVKRNLKQGRRAFDDCGDYDVWTDTGFVAATYKSGAEKQTVQENVPCFYPLIEALDDVYESYPNATWLLSLIHI